MLLGFEKEDDVDDDDVGKWAELRVAASLIVGPHSTFNITTYKPSALYHLNNKRPRSKSVGKVPFFYIMHWVIDQLASVVGICGHSIYRILHPPIQLLQKCHLCLLCFVFCKCDTASTCVS